MIGMVKSIAVAGALLMVAAPAFAQRIDTNPLGLPLVPNSVDLDPLHIFTPAPKPGMMHHRMRHHFMHRHHAMSHHHAMFHHHAMHHRMMKPMAKKKMGKKMMSKSMMKKKG